MILQGSTLAGVDHSRKMVQHLLKDENEKIVIHDALGMGNDEQALMDAMVEMQLYTKMTRGETGIFHVAINPREDDVLTPEQQLQAIEIIEKKFGLTDQAKLRVDHVKDGRAHSHMFWSMVLMEEQKLVDLGQYKRQLQECAQQMTQQFELEEVRRTPDEQTIQVNNADRMMDNRPNRTAPKYMDRKKQVTQIWEDTREQGAEVFIEGLQAAGYGVARGSKAAVVLIDQDGGQFNLARDLPRLVKAKHVRERFGEMMQNLPSVEEALSYRHYDAEQERINQQTQLHDAADVAGQKKAERQKETEDRHNRNKKNLAERQRKVLERGTDPKAGKSAEKKMPANDEHLTNLDKERQWDGIAGLRRREQAARMKSSYEQLNERKGRIAEIEKALKAHENDLPIMKRVNARKVKALQDELEALKQTVQEFEPRIQEEEKTFEKNLEKTKPPEIKNAQPEEDQSSVIDFEAASEKAKEELAREKFREELKREREKREKRRQQERDLDHGMGYD